MEKRKRGDLNEHFFIAGFTRLNLPWTSSDEEIEFILSALKDVSENAWRLLPQYQLNNETGEWKHRSNLEYR